MNRGNKENCCKIADKILDIPFGSIRYLEEKDEKNNVNVERLIFRDPAVRVNLQDPFFRHVHLVLPDGFPGGVQLAVQVGQAYPVVVDQVERADARPDRVNPLSGGEHSIDGEEDRYALANDQLSVPGLYRSAAF